LSQKLIKTKPTLINQILELLFTHKLLLTLLLKELAALRPKRLMSSSHQQNVNSLKKTGESIKEEEELELHSIEELRSN